MITTSLPTGITPGCPIRTALEMLSGKWRLLVLHQLAAGPLRFGELRRRLPDISEKVLVQELKHLAIAGLLVRTDHGQVPPRVSYHLTAVGRRALPLLAAAAEFGSAYAAHRQADQAQIASCHSVILPSAAVSLPLVETRPEHGPTPAYP